METFKNFFVKLKLCKNCWKLTFQTLFICGAESAKVNCGADSSAQFSQAELIPILIPVNFWPVEPIPIPIPSKTESIPEPEPIPPESSTSLALVCRQRTPGMSHCEM